MKKKIDTIIAAATPAGRGGVAVVRVSGPLTTNLAEKILGKIPRPRFATYSSFLDENNHLLDQGLAIFFPGPNSFTGEDVLELHAHGSPIVIDRILKRLSELGARLAKPGEFSERAFLNDKLDLTQAEAVADLIDASSEQAARSALRSLQGEFSKKIRELVEHLIQARIFVEAAIDFVEEEIDFLSEKKLRDKLDQIVIDLNKVQASAKQGSLLRDGINVVIAGKPNVGKSTLLNQLSGKDVAIVTDIPGTTRDVLREFINLDGIPLHIIDTAGLHVSSDIVEQEGMRRAREEIDKADLVLVVAVDSFEEMHFKNKCIYIRNKIDLTNQFPTLSHQEGKTVISLSAKTGAGMDLLKQHIKNLIGYQENSEGLFSARRRHLDALARAKTFLENGMQQLNNHKAGELLAEDLRQAQNVLSEITGEFTSDDLLGKIFASFCIGK